MKPTDVEVLRLYQNIETGGIYEVTAIARHSETEELMVVYQPAHPDGTVWVRPFQLFCEKFIPCKVSPEEADAIAAQGWPGGGE